MANKKNKETINQSAVYSVTSYTTKKGGTAYLIFGFESKEAAEKIAKKCSKTVCASCRTGEKGEKRYCLSLGTRYGEVAQQLCDALNKGDKTAIGKACKASIGVYDAVVAKGKSKSEGQEKPQTEKVYTAKEVGDMIVRFLKGEPLPDGVMANIPKEVIDMAKAA